MKTVNYWIKTILGIFMMTPALISVPLFIMNLFNKESGPIASLANISYKWSGQIRIDYDFRSGGGGGGGYTSALPLYFGLMAIAGALLLANNNKQ